MLSSSLVASLAVVGHSAVSTNVAGASVTPLQQVISMLDTMQVKGKKDKHEEEVAFSAFHEWCDQTQAETKKNIAQAAAQIEQLKADIIKAEADAAELAQEIAELNDKIEKKQDEADKATAIRKNEKADYTATHTDFSESIDAIERALVVLKSREKDVPQSLLQVSQMPELPASAKAVIKSFVQLSNGEPGDQEGVPEANAYEFQSGGVVAILEKLRLKFQDQRLQLQKEEMNSKHNYEMLKQELTDDIKYAKATVEKKTARKAQRQEDAAVAKGDKETTEAGKAEDEQKLSDTLAECNAKSVEFEQNQIVRAEEIKTVAQAIGILQSEAVSGSADKYLPTFVQVRSGSSMAQLRGDAGADVRKQVAAFLQGRAAKLGSKYLALIASHAADDPFGKVKKMIKDLIVKLMEQANSEADAKAYCDTELATNKQTREDKQAEVEELSATIEKNEAASAQLAEEISALSDAVAKLRQEQAEATKLRSEEKTRNTETIADAKAATSAVEKAMQLLKNFYGNAADGFDKSDYGYNFAQGGAGSSIRQEMSQASKVPYKGMQAEHGGIIGFLDVVLSDFARLEAETSSAEDQAQSDYDRYMAETTQDIEVKEAEVGHKTANKQATDATIAKLEKELSLTQEELDAALEYFDKLKPDCVDHGLSYDKRKEMREEEIQSLKEALAILNQQDLA